MRRIDAVAGSKERRRSLSEGLIERPYRTLTTRLTIPRRASASRYAWASARRANWPYRMWYCPFGASASLTRTSNPRERTGRAAATAAAREGWRPSTTSGTPASSTTVPRPRSRAASRASSTEAKPVAVTTNTRAVSSLRNRTVECPRRLSSASSRSAASPGGKGPLSSAYRSGVGAGGRGVTDTFAAEASGWARSDRAELSVGSGAAGTATTEGGGAVRPHQRGQGPETRYATSQVMTTTSTTTLAAARGTWVYREISQRIGGTS